MAVSAAVEQRRATGRWVLLASAVVAVAIHLWGLYRPVGPPIPLWFPAADKVEHLIGFAAPLLLILLSRRSFLRARRRTLPRSSVVALTCLVAVNGVVSELYQSAFLPSRSGDPLDTAADWVGCAVGVCCYLLVERRQTGRAPRSSP